jgi:hypothetical protein
VLFFEFFPAFVMILSIFVGVGLYAANARARHDPPEERPQPRQPASTPPGRTIESTGLRSSMRP